MGPGRPSSLRGTLDTGESGPQERSVRPKRWGGVLHSRGRQRAGPRVRLRARVTRSARREPASQPLSKTKTIRLFALLRSAVVSLFLCGKTLNGPMDICF